MLEKNLLIYRSRFLNLKADSHFLSHIFFSFPFSHLHSSCIHNETTPEMLN